MSRRTVRYSRFRAALLSLLGVEEVEGERVLYVVRRVEGVVDDGGQGEGGEGVEA